MYTRCNIQALLKKFHVIFRTSNFPQVLVLILLKYKNLINLASYTNALRAEITCK